MSAVPDATPQFLVKKALQKIGVIDSREEPDIDQMKDGIEALWFMLDEWNTQDTMIPYITTFTFPVNSQQREYTIGPGGDFDIPRPLDLLIASWINEAGTEFPIKMVGYQVYTEGNSAKDVTVTRPYQLWYNPTYPTATITLNAFPLDNDQLQLKMLLPFTAETCECCAEGCGGCIAADCSDSGVVDPDDYNVVVTGCPDGDDACILSGETQMDAYLATQCSTNCDETYEQDFLYDPGTGDITITATATPIPRTAMKSTKLYQVSATDLPPGYNNLLIWSLAEVLAPEYNMEPPIIVQRKAMQLKAWLKARNNRAAELIVDKAITYPKHFYDIYAGPTTGNY